MARNAEPIDTSGGVARQKTGTYTTIVMYPTSLELTPTPIISKKQASVTLSLIGVVYPPIVAPSPTHTGERTALPNYSKRVSIMIDFLFSIASGILQMDLRDPHDIPFALPIVFSGMLGFVMGFILLQFIGNENKQDKQ